MFIASEWSITERGREVYQVCSSSIYEQWKARQRTRDPNGQS